MRTHSKASFSCPTKVSQRQLRSCGCESLERVAKHLPVNGWLLTELVSSIRWRKACWAEWEQREFYWPALAPVMFLAMLENCSRASHEICEIWNLFMLENCSRAPLYTLSGVDICNSAVVTGELLPMRYMWDGKSMTIPLRNSSLVGTQLGHSFAVCQSQTRLKWFECPIAKYGRHGSFQRELWARKTTGFIWSFAYPLQLFLILFGPGQTQLSQRGNCWVLLLQTFWGKAIQT